MNKINKNNIWYYIKLVKIITLICGKCIFYQKKVYIGEKI